MSKQNTNTAIKQLSASVRKFILLLNNKLPNSVGRFWVTYEELYERLVHAGVSKLLQVTHVKEACTYANTGQKFLATWKWNNKQYYRSKLVHDHECAINGDCAKNEVPLEQRHKAKSSSPNLKSTSPQTRININAERDYFIGQNIQEFDQLNKALTDLDKMENADRDAKLSECPRICSCSHCNETISFL